VSEITTRIADFVSQSGTGSRSVVFYDGQPVFEPKDSATEFFVVAAGEVRLFEIAPDGDRRLLDILGPGRCFGFASLGRIPQYEKLASSVGDSSVRVISADRLREMLLTHGEMALEFVETMARQVHLAWSEGSHFVFEDCRLRLIRTLLRFRNSPAARPVSGGVELRMTHAQLAQAVGVARETISLCLTQLKRENLVQTSRNRVSYNPDRLEHFDPQPEFIPELAIAG
jgi:CRP/FNR family transcriptional regulator, cyclic AMP receptor protein